jgi:hypothetical protein
MADVVNAVHFARAHQVLVAVRGWSPRRASLV